MRVKNGLNVSQAVTGERRNLRHRGAGDRKPNDRRASKIVKREVADAGTVRQLAPRRPEPVGGPRAAEGVGEDHRPPTLRGVEQGPQRPAGGHHNAPAGLGLLKPDVGAVVGRPGRAPADSLYGLLRSP